MRHAAEAKAAIAIGIDKRRARQMRSVCAARRAPSSVLSRSGAVSESSPGADAEIDQDRRGNEHRRVGADQDHAEHHRRREAVDRLAAEKQQRQQGQRNRHVGDHRTRQRLVDRRIEQIRHWQFPVPAQHFADTIVDDDSVVERIAEDRQQRRDTCEIEIDLVTDMKPIVSTISCTLAIMAPRANCHSKRNQR